VFAAGATRGHGRRLATAAIAFVFFATAGTASAGKPGGGGGSGKPKADTTPPSLRISSPAAGAAVRSTITVSGTASDNVQVASVAVSVDGGAYVAAQGTTSWSYALDTRALADGAHTVTTRAKDAAGNAGTASVSFTSSNADTTPPVVTISAPSGGATVGGKVSVVGTAADAGGLAGVSVSVDGGLYQPATGTATWTDGVDTTSLADGTHTITARAIDMSGNAATASVSVDVQNADTTAPSVQISNPAVGATLSGTATVSGTAADNVQVASVAVSVDGGAYAAAQGTTSWSYSLVIGSLANGAHTISVRATDASGNAATASVAVNVQNSLPAGVADQLVTPEGATIQVYSGVSGWTAQQVYDLLKPNAYQLALIGPHLTVKVQTTYNTFTTTSAGTSGGVYASFNATMYLDARSNSLLLTRPDATIAHEYGAVWSMYHLYLTEQGNWTLWLQARGLLNDPRVDSSDVWSKGEMIADDYRMLFGTQAAQSEMSYVNPDVPDPRSVSGLKDFFVNVWGA
jgi:Bacterial Ig domain